MTSNKQADLERESARNKTNGEFGTKTQTAPDAAVALVSNERFQKQNRLFMDGEMERTQLNRKQFYRAREILSMRIHAEGFDGRPHMLLVNDGNDGYGEISFYPQAILDVHGNTLWTPDGGNDRSGTLHNDLSGYTHGLGTLGPDHIELDWRENRIGQGAYDNEDGLVYGVELWAPAPDRD
jgi:hypothetical protein